MQPSSLQRSCHLVAAVSLVTLIVLCLAWELVLAPLRPGGSWLVLKILPLLWPLRGVLRRNIYTLQWSSMLILLYFMEGIVRAMSDPGFSAVLAWIEVALTSLFFISALLFLRPYKKAAKALTQQAIRKASQ